jgi:hypothetical protein
VDTGLAWLAVQGALVFVNMLWHAVAGYQVRSLIEAHVRQFATLRSMQLLAWLVTAGVGAAWLRRLRASRRVLASRQGPGRARLPLAPRRGLMVALGGLAAVALAADLLARALAFRSGGPLALGLLLQLLVLGQVAAGAAAALAIAAVLGVDRRFAEAAQPGPSIRA